MSEIFDAKNEVVKPDPTKASIYVRMSTDHQKYSTENQEDAIREYADKKNLEIIKVYADHGKSGLKIEGRDALKCLIDDVENKRAAYGAILVLDVTRWGRFQDADESAYYEYICRRAGIDVKYVAEQFENDGSPVATIVKGVKRAMAGEYSRELSGKVFAGQCRLIEKGYRQGGPAGYGLRRMLIDEDGLTKGILKSGQHKSFQTDRVILVPGPDEEIENVRWMYSAFIDEGMKESQIATELNRRAIKTDFGREWTRGTVHQILTNEKYIGNNVFNRTSNKLKKRHVENDPEMWVRAEGVFEAIVNTSDFYTVQGILRERNRRYSNEEMLEKLQRLQERNGWLSGVVIDEQEDMPSSGSYQSRFGSLIRAYKLIGYTPDHDYRYIEINRYLRKLHAELFENTISKIEALGATVKRQVGSDLLLLNDEISVSMIICRCLQTNAGSYRWKMRLDSGLEPDITIAIRMDAQNQQPLDYYLLPAIDIENPKLRLSEHNGLALDAYRFDDLEAFFVMTEREAIKEPA
ncbi:MAG: recombinase family protein [Rickettsiales bacterium]|nr:recombinase family protein [Rickettsiales bacterium]